MGVATAIQVRDGQMLVRRTQDCTPIAEDAKARHNAGYLGTGEMKHAARLPSVMIEAYCNARGITFQEWMANPAHAKAMCEDSALAHFRIWKGRM
ncbi:MAG: hypothetical protein V4505_25620 [Pseudomonadota bacterium]